MPSRTNRSFDLSTSRWVPIERVSDRTGSKGYKEEYWLMECSCGIRREVNWKNYFTGRSRSCGCYRREVSNGPRENARKLAPGESARNNLILVYKRGATRRGYLFELTTEQFTELTSSRCHYCNKLPNRTHLPVAKGIYGAYQYNGIDRKDNKQGYIFENCIPACTECNRSKGVLTFDEFIAHLDSLVVFRNTL